MKTFKHFLKEAKLIADYRSDEHKKNNEPFHVRKLANDKYPVVDNRIQAHLPPIATKYSEMTIHPHEDKKWGHSRPTADYQSQEYKHWESNHKGFMVDPKEKKIILDPKDSRLNRRYTSKINSGQRKSKTSIPVLGGDTTDLPHHELRKTLKDLHKVHPVHDYTIHGDDRWEGQKVGHFVKQPTEYEKYLKGQPITLYHGTSAAKAKKILKHGLNPGQRKENYADQIEGHSEHNVYLSTTPHEAANYATRQHVEDKSNPVVLKVTVHPKHFDKFKPDEDTIHWGGDLGKHVVKHLEKKHPEITAGQIHRSHILWAKKSTGKVTLGRGDIPEPRQQEIAKDYLHHFLNKHTSLHQHSSIAFRGSIHPKHVEVHSTWETEKISADPDHKEYYDAHNKMAATKKNTLKEAIRNVRTKR
jgi:hypothetical protein